MATMNLSVEARNDTGKGVARKLRAVHKLPAVLYGAEREARPFSIDETEFRHVLSTPAKERVILKLAVPGEKGSDIMAVIRDIQRHPLSGNLLHADLMAIQMDKPFDVDVPVHGEGVPYGVKTDGGVLEWMNRTLRIRCLPTAIPDHISVDLEPIKVGETIHVSDLEAADFEFLSEPDTPVCSVAITRMTLAVEAAEGEEEAEGEGEGAVEGEGEGEGTDAKPESEDKSK